MSYLYGERGAQFKRRRRLQLMGGRALVPCCFCGRPLTAQTATLEHVVPRSQGGDWSKNNLRLSCEPCNTERGTEDFAAFRRRVQARRGRR